ncbi:hypothetical protein [Kitasatospora kifunensis]|uniref:Malate/lactate dehydrogenase n=1 Tax=Kitasatospora kifunensis TaxID=58351 RepID=A0A7W7VUL5_KITKI|nr:hypothetical protein [Kitasatospora kifunensis]MBB4922605.1 malate/lactate dehydrogenase [Kitasatospora kifunensis]
MTMTMTMTRLTRRLRTAAALTLALGAGLATAGTASAAAATATAVTAAPAVIPPGFTLHAEYYYQDQCTYFGNLGVTNHQWTSYFCTWTPFNPPFTGSGIMGVADLYVN